MYIFGARITCRPLYVGRIRSNSSVLLGVFGIISIQARLMGLQLIENCGFIELRLGGGLGDPAGNQGCASDNHDHSECD